VLIAIVIRPGRLSDVQINSLLPFFADHENDPMLDLAINVHFALQMRSLRELVRYESTI